MRSLADQPSTAYPASATLRRGPLARVRTIRLYEFAAWCGVLVLAYDLWRGVGESQIVLLLLGVLGGVVRVAIATESVRCDESGVSWRSVFATYRVRWDDIATIEVAAKHMRIGFIRGHPNATAPCVSIVRTGDQSSLWVTPSVWTSLARQGEFVAAARLISPTDWSSPDEFSDRRTARPGHRPSGKRVGRPTR